MSKEHRALRKRFIVFSTQVRSAMALLIPLVLMSAVLCLWGASCSSESQDRAGEDRTSNALDSAEKGGRQGRAKANPRAKRGKRNKGRPGKAGNAKKGPGPLPPEVIAQREKERELPESVFIETDENRDPFRSFLAVFSVQALPEEEFAPRPPVLLEEVSLDELRLIAIVSGEGGNPRAMLVDPDGKGWVVRRGDYVGRGERIRLGPGQPEREINWRVVRVRPDRIILVREDPVQAGPPVTKVMRLYPEEEG